MKKIKNKINKLAVLMATYNGDKYINEQLKSILNQTYKNFDLIIRDDGSSDGTVSIIRSVIFKNPEQKIILLENKSDVHGQLENFSFLFDYAKDKYDFIMFSDQDDVWYSNKIQLSLDIIKLNASEPTLVYTNYLNWNMKDQSKTPAYTKVPECTFERIFVQNWTMGCTYILNKKMIQKIGHIPIGVENHDYWIALVSSMDHNIKYLSKVTMEHRLHAGNVTARENSTSWKDRFFRLNKEVLRKKGRDVVYSRWYTIYINLIKKYKNKQVIKQLSRVLFSHNIKSCYLSYRYGYKAVTIKYDFVFRLYLLLKPKNMDGYKGERKCKS